MTTRPTVRVIYAHNADTDDANAEAVQIKAQIKARHPSRVVEVTTGAADWERHWRRLGSWEQWRARIVTARARPGALVPFEYTHCIASSRTLGPQVMWIVAGFLRTRRGVYLARFDSGCLVGLPIIIAVRRIAGTDRYIAILADD